MDHIMTFKSYKMNENTKRIIKSGLFLTGMALSNKSISQTLFNTKPIWNATSTIDSQRTHNDSTFNQLIPVYFDSSKNKYFFNFESSKKIKNIRIYVGDKLKYSFEIDPNLNHDTNLNSINEWLNICLDDIINIKKYTSTINFLLFDMDGSTYNSNKLWVDGWSSKKIDIQKKYIR